MSREKMNVEMGAQTMDGIDIQWPCGVEGKRDVEDEGGNELSDSLCNVIFCTLGT